MDRRKNRKESSTARRKSMCLKNIARNSRSVLSPVDFNSETLSSCSSPLKPDRVIKTKVQRKKIRSTQDFNQLNASSTSQDSDVSVKSESKKTKKARGTYALPKITHLLEDPFSVKNNNSLDMFTESKTTWKMNRKRRSSLTQWTTETNSIEQNISSMISNNGGVEKNAINKISKRSNLSDDSLKSQDKNSGVSENDEDCEIKVKRKRKVKNKGSIDNIVTIRALNKVNKDYEMRLRKMLSNDYILSTDESNENLNTKNSLRKISDVKSSNKKTKKSIRFADTSPKEDNIRRSTFDVDKCKSSIKLFNERSVENISNPIIQINDDLKTNIPEILSRNVDFDNATFGEQNLKEISFLGDFENRSIKWNNTLCKQVSPVNAVVNGYKEVDLPSPIFGTNKHFIKTSLIPTNEVLTDINSPKYLNEKSENGISNVHLTVGSQSIIDLTTPYEKKLYKHSDNVLIKSSSGEQGLKETSFLGDFENRSSKWNNTLCKQVSPVNAVVNGYKEMDLPSPIFGTNNKHYVKNSLIPTNEVLTDINSPKYLNEKSGNGVSNVHLTVDSQSIIDLTTPYENKLYKHSDNMSIKSSCEKKVRPSSIRKLRRESTFRKDVTKNEQNLNTTFDNNHCNSNNNFQTIKVLRESELNRSPNKMSEQSITGMSTIPVSKSTGKTNLFENSTQAQRAKYRDNNLGVFDSITPIDNYLNICNASNKTSTTPKLNRTATFIKDDMQCISPVVNNSVAKEIDTSKVTKRRQWDKSRLSISFLDNSVDIGNVSAPWKGDTLNDTFKISNRDESEVLDNLQTSVTRNKIYGAPPSGTSTPLPESKNNFLKRVLSKGNNVTTDETKHASKPSGKPIVKARTKMPNFALIHQRAYDKLESLKEMSERKAQRAKLLLSGCKPGSSTNMNTSSKSKKFLQFNPAESIKSSPLKTTKSNESVKKIKLNSSIISITKLKEISPSRSNPNVVLNKLTPIEKKKELLKAKPVSRIPTKIIKNISEQKGVTKYGFKAGPMGAKKITKEEQLKAVATKTRVAKNTIEGRRNLIQGVRSNRRFELLMGLRKK